METTISRFLSWHDCEPECDHDLREVLATDAAQRETMEQQAREIERLQVELLASRSHVEAWSAQVQKERNTLAAMTAERDEWKRKSELVTNDPDYQQCCQVREQAQARVGEIEAEKQSSDFLRKRAFEELQKQVATSRQLQATLAERERALNQAEGVIMLREATLEQVRDDRDSTEKRYAVLEEDFTLACQQRDLAHQDAARLREAALWAMKKVKRLSTRAIDYKRADDFIQHEEALKGA